MRRITHAIGYVLSGSRMIDRLTMLGHTVSLNASEVTHALAMLIIALAAIPSSRDVTQYHGAIGLALAAPQIGGIVLAWAGVCAPVQRLRITLLILSMGWWGSAVVLYAAYSPTLYPAILMGLLGLNCVAAARAAGGVDAMILTDDLRRAAEAIDPAVHGYRHGTPLAAYRAR